jgi:ribosome-binding protein aMBF1 (putative translation factor)
VIKNNRAYLIAKAARTRFERALADHEALAKAAEPIGRAAEISALRGQLQDLQEQVAAYEHLRSGAVQMLTVSRLEDVPALLIRARIALGLTHAHLAERLEVKPQQIQRWEDDDYQSAAFWRLVDVADALGLAFEISARPVGLGAEKHAAELLEPAGVDAVHDA